MLADQEALRRLYATDGLSAAAIGRQLGVRANRVVRALHRHGIPTRPVGRRPASGDPTRQALADDRAWLEARLAEGLSVAGVAAWCGLSESTVYERLAAHNITRPRRRPGRLHDPVWLLHHHADLGWPATKIADLLGLHASTVRRAIRPLRGTPDDPASDLVTIRKRRAAGDSVAAIAADLGIDTGRVVAALALHR